MWEYKVIEMLPVEPYGNLEDWLNDLGMVGWELVTVMQKDNVERYVFKKRL